MERVILVENKNQDLRLTIKALLENQGYDVITSESSEDCIKKIRNGEKPQLIIIESTMPRKGILEIVNRLKDVKIVYLVMDELEASEIDLFENVVGFIEEPRDIKQFIKKINDIIKE